jgi:hypothetical protein
MADISSVGKVAYIYKSNPLGTGGTWHPIAGYANTSAPYSWSANHNFTSTVSFESVVNSKFGINNFLDTAARDIAIPPSSTNPNGIVAFVRQTNEGQILNQIQYLYNNQWRVYGENAQLLSKSSNFILSLSDAGRTIDIDTSSSVTVTIPENVVGSTFLVGTQIAFIRSGTGEVNFTTVSGSPVTIQSKNGNKYIAAQWSPATLIQKSNNTWILIGDLKA